MKKLLSFALCLLLCVAFGCSPDAAVNSEMCYAEAIMVDGTIYYKTFGPMPGEVDPNAILGYTASITDTFPDEDGETNFGTEDMPYARVQEGIAVLYENEWYLCTTDK